MYELEGLRGLTDTDWPYGATSLAFEPAKGKLENVGKTITRKDGPVK